MKYLLDTNTCVQYLRFGAASPVAAKFAAMHRSDIVLCSVVVAELLFGVLRSNNPSKNLADVLAFRSEFLSLPFDDMSGEEYARVRADLATKGTPIGPNDMLIAAIVLSNHLTLVTHNTAEFSRVVGLTLEDWQIKNKWPHFSSSSARPQRVTVPTALTCLAAQRWAGRSRKSWRT